MSVYRIYVEKKEPFAVEAAGVLASLRNDLGLSKLRHVRLLNRYDVEGISREVFDSGAGYRLLRAPGGYGL